MIYGFLAAPYHWRLSGLPFQSPEGLYAIISMGLNKVEVVPS